MILANAGVYGPDSTILLDSIQSQAKKQRRKNAGAYEITVRV